LLKDVHNQLKTLKMKKLSSILLIATAALGFQACKSSSSSSSSTDSTTVTKDSTAKTTVSAAPVDKDDSTFAVTAANDGMAEVAAGNMAQQKAVSPRVKAFATMMVTDHGKAGAELAAIAKTKNITLPSAPDADKQKMAADMNKMTGKDFDKDYVNGMVDGHEKAVKLFTDASTSLKDSTLRAFAVKTLPTLKMHLDSIKAIKASMK
jgi:putative membrane protein